MTEHEKIMELAKEYWHRDSFNIEYFDAVAFYHAAQKDAFEQAAKVCHEVGSRDTCFEAMDCAEAIRQLGKEK